MIKFLHIRKCDVEENKDGFLNYILSQFGGLTVAYTVADELGIDVSLAFCHPKDHFSREIGRELAAHRLRSEAPYEILPFQHPIAATIREWISGYFGYELIERA